MAANQPHDPRQQLMGRLQGLFPLKDPAWHADAMLTISNMPVPVAATLFAGENEDYVRSVIKAFVGKNARAEAATAPAARAGSGVVAFASAAGTGLTSEEIEVSLVHALEKAKSDQVSIAAFSVGHWGCMSQHLGMKLKLCKEHELAVPVDAGPHMSDFVWDERPEPSQAERYMPHLQHLIPQVGSIGCPLVWLERGDKNKNLLDLQGHEASLYYSNITGNTGAAIITKDSQSACSPREGLCVLFELKKVVDQQCVYQAACQSIVAALLSPQWQPVVVLTDLAEHWQLFWVDGSFIRHGLLPTQRAAAVIGGCVDQAAAWATSGTDEALPALPAILARRKSAELEDKVRAAAAMKAAAAMNPDLLDLEGMLPAEEMRDVYAHMLLQQVSMLPAFSTSQCGGVSSMHI